MAEIQFIFIEYLYYNYVCFLLRSICRTDPSQPICRSPPVAVRHQWASLVFVNAFLDEMTLNANLGLKHAEEKMQSQEPKR